MIEDNSTKFSIDPKEESITSLSEIESKFFKAAFFGLGSPNQSKKEYRCGISRGITKVSNSPEFTPLGFSLILSNTKPWLARGCLCSSTAASQANSSPFSGVIRIVREG